MLFKRRKISGINADYAQSLLQNSCSTVSSSPLDIYELQRLLNAAIDIKTALNALHDQKYTYAGYEFRQTDSGLHIVEIN